MPCDGNAEADPIAWLRAAITERLELAKTATQVPWEAEADLAILDEHRGEVSEWGGHRPDGTWQQRGLVCMTCGHDDGRLGVAWPCRTVRLLASGYRHRPGYEAAWGEAERLTP